MRVVVDLQLRISNRLRASPQQRGQRTSTKTYSPPGCLWAQGSRGDTRREPSCSKHSASACKLVARITSATSIALSCCRQSTPAAIRRAVQILVDHIQVQSMQLRCGKTVWQVPSLAHKPVHLRFVFWPQACCSMRLFLQQLLQLAYFIHATHTLCMAQPG